MLLGFSIAYSTRSQLNTWFVHLLAQAGPCIGIWRGTVLDWPGSVFMVGEPPKPGFAGCWVRPGQGMAELEAMFGLPEGGHPGIWFRGRRAALACGANA